MAGAPSPGLLDYAAGSSAVVLLFIAYVVYPNTILQYGVWLTIFTIWMAWFVYYGTKWMYGVDEEPS
ncbi:hypothetical protein [Halovenus halobia]|uniref:hypothetical protein n=1 Tax=Halovenus halobia TaxID=3396622 RepID=UPI003F543762